VSAEENSTLDYTPAMVTGGVRSGSFPGFFLRFLPSLMDGKAREPELLHA
jgi:hypothetical protein